MRKFKREFKIKGNEKILGIIFHKIGYMAEHKGLKKKISAPSFEGVDIVEFEKDGNILGLQLKTTDPETCELVITADFDFEDILTDAILDFIKENILPLYGTLSREAKRKIKDIFK
jgi:hypothetical protein